MMERPDVSFKTALTSPFVLGDPVCEVHGFGYRDAHQFPISISRPRTCYTFIYVYEQNYLGSVPYEPVSEETFRVFTPGTPLYYGCEEKFWSHTHLTASGSLVERLVRESGLVLDTALHLPAPHAMESAALDLQRASCGLNRVRPEVAGRILSRLITTVASQTAPCSDDRLAVPRCFQDARDALVDSYREPLQVADLAQRCDLSTSYFAAQFRHYFGVSPKELIIKLRIEAAKHELRSQEHERVSEVAHLVGYDDVYHFSKLFHRRTGMSPSEYRHHSCLVSTERFAAAV